MIKIITVTSHAEHAVDLIRTAKKNGWDIVVIQSEWRGFGTKLVETYNYLKANPDVKEFIFCDAFDVFVMGDEKEFRSKLDVDTEMLVSTEKGLWPPTLIPFKKSYQEYEGGFNFINSGCYYAKSGFYIDLFDNYPPFYEIDDQIWLHIASWFNHKIKKDYYQNIFNSHSFIADGEYTYENGRVKIMGNEPIFIHFNGSGKNINPEILKKLGY